MKNKNTTALTSASGSFTACMQAMRILLLVCLVACSVCSQAQIKPIIYSTLGEDIPLLVGHGVPGKPVTVTNRAIYYTGTYIAPFGEHIVDARFKLDPNGFAIQKILVLHSNGMVCQIDANNMANVQYLDPVPDNNVEEILGDDLYVMSYDRVYVSDSGFNWQVDTAGLGSFNFPKDIDIDTTQKVWLATTNGLFTQELDSTTWIRNTNYPGQPFAPLSCDLVFIDRLQHVWVSSFNTLRVSTDGGASFQVAPSGLGSGFIRDICDDAFGNAYVMFDNSLYYSQGGTQPFTRIDLPVIADFPLFGTNSSVYNDALGDTLIYLATDAGVYNSADQGATWVYDGSVLAENINSVAATGDHRLLMTSNVGLFRMEGSGSWTKRYPQTGFIPGSMVFTASNGDVYLHANTVFKSTDNGENFSADTAGLGAAGVVLNKFFTDESGTQHASGIAASSGELQVWTKLPGNPWQTDNAGLPAAMNFNYSTNCFGTDNNGKVYVAIFNSNNSSATVYSRPTAGGSWTSETVINGPVYNVKGRNGTVTVASDAGIQYNNGSGWQTVPLPAGVSTSVDWCLSEIDKNGVLWGYYETFDPNFGPFGGSRGEGVFYSKDFATWKAAGIDTVLFGSLVAIGDSVFALTTGNNGVYVLDTNINTSVRQVKAGELGVTVYPNPSTGMVSFESSTTLSEIRIYNVAGETVYARELHSRNVNIDLSHLAKGAYFYMLTGDNKTRKGGKFILK